MGGNCTVLRPRLMCKLAMSPKSFIVGEGQSGVSYT